MYEDIKAGEERKRSRVPVSCNAGGGPMLDVNNASEISLAATIR